MHPLVVADPGEQVEEVDRLIAETQELLDEIAERLSPLLAEQARGQERLRLLKELRSTFPAGVYADDARGGPMRLVGGSAKSVRGRVQACVGQLLEESTAPLHTNDLHRLFLERGWPIPGAGRPGNISAHLTDASGIYSPRRGYWALGERPAPPRPRPRRHKSQRS